MEERELIQSILTNWLTIREVLRELHKYLEDEVLRHHLQVLSGSPAWKAAHQGDSFLLTMKKIFREGGEPARSAWFLAETVEVPLLREGALIKTLRNSGQSKAVQAYSLVKEAYKSRIFRVTVPQDFWRMARRWPGDLMADEESAVSQIREAAERLPEYPSKKDLLSSLEDPEYRKLRRRLASFPDKG